jgi:hypothetical protein
MSRRNFKRSVAEVRSVAQTVAAYLETGRAPTQSILTIMGEALGRALKDMGEEIPPSLAAQLKPKK